MKKFFFAAIAAGIALTACVTNEEEVSVGTDAKISFEAPLVQNATRVTGEIGTNYDKNESFVVNAKFYQSTFNTWAGGTNYMTDETVTYNSGLNAWVSALDYYWPKQGSLTFMAYSPADHTTWKPAIAGTPEVLKADGVIISNGNRDMLYSELIKNKVGSDNPGANAYNGVDILFRHALSSIKFKVCLATDLGENTIITLKAIQLQHVHQNGNFSWDLNVDHDPEWTNTNTNNEYVITPVTGANQVLTETPTDVANAQPCIMMPQTLVHGGTDGNVVAVIKYDITNTDESGVVVSTISQERTVDLSNLDYGEGQGINAKWLPGKRYIYTVNAGLNRITFAPVVEDWVDQEVNYE